MPIFKPSRCKHYGGLVVVTRHSVCMYCGGLTGFQPLMVHVL
ncbi:hypothetical protein LEMLEM_LOCUS14813 [Lemmus lemmus]